MNFSIFSFVFAACLLANCGLGESCQSEAKKLDLSFYITSRCPDTIRFVINQLYPVYQEFKDQLNIEFVPWAKSKRNPDGTITCQFGPTDCTANRLQSCALFLLGDDQEKQMEYIYCEKSTQASVSLDYKCVTQVGLSESVTKQCYDSLLGDELLAENERKTGEIVMTFVPTIVYNHVYSASVQAAAYGDFRKFVTDLLAENTKKQNRNDKKRYLK